MNLKIIDQYFAKAATTDYIGEAVSQIEHALQCAYFAEKSGHSEEVILACLLHDIGHFSSTTEQNQMADLGVVYHEWIGAQLAYELNFSAKVALLIGYHVDAKRYLAGKNMTYYERLSSASKQTLGYQGGPMDAEEMQAFEQLPYFKEILQVRVNDEKAKEVDLVVPGLEHYYPLMQRNIQKTSSVESYNLPDFVNAQWVEEFKHCLIRSLALYQSEPQL